ncbi:MAG: SMC family ATPase [Methanobacterium sp.]|nr:SMC family ATPase [Methanobacterium sp.]
MIFNTLRMENIRSYEKCRIEFPRGTSLFEGDVGSGKSTILMALEFALFGLGNQKGDALLRKGAKKGSVFLDFSVGDKKYQIKRTLLRNDKNTIRQDKGELGVNGRKMQLSPSEIKERILDILNFKEPPNPRSQSVIFRYAVYTPQEEMKFILSQKPDIRLQTLRNAFGIEDYKIAVENATQISRLIKNKINYLNGQISDLSNKKDSLIEIQGKLSDNKKLLVQYQERLKVVEDELERKKTQLGNLKEKESNLKQIQAEIPHLKKQIQDKLDLSDKYAQDIKKMEDDNRERLQPEINRLENKEKPVQISQEKLREKIENIRELTGKRERLGANLSLLLEDQQKLEEELNDWKDKDQDDLNKETIDLVQRKEKEKESLDSHESQLQIIIQKIYKFEAQMEDVNKKLNNLNGLGESCPICGSVLDEDHKKNLKKEREQEMRRGTSEIKILKEVRSKGEQKVEQDKIKLKELEKESNQFEIIKSKYKTYNEIKTKITAINEQITNIDEKISLYMDEPVSLKMDQYLQHLENLSTKIKEYEQEQETLKSIIYQFDGNKEKIKENLGNIDILIVEIEKLKEDLATYEHEVEEVSEILHNIEVLQTSYEEVGKDETLLNRNIITTQTLIIRFEEDVLALENEIKEKEILRKQSDRLKDYYIWLNEYMIPTLSVIEKHVMQNIHLEFDDNFKKWFNLLIDDPSKTGKIDEEFTPIVEQDGFEQEINYLSGGEKTSVALAYRLALNNIVQKVSTGMKSNLLIMDEPTDGFSKEQLFKIRDILNELKYPQIIIVSHERELESFADNIFKIEKADGVSNVSQV